MDYLFYGFPLAMIALSVHFLQLNLQIFNYESSRIDCAN